MAVLEYEDNLVELRALEVELFAGHFVAHVAALAVVSDLERLERRLLRIHFVVAAGLRQARIQRAVFFKQSFEVANDVFGQGFQVLPRLGKVGLHLLHLFAVFVDVE